MKKGHSPKNKTTLEKILSCDIKILRHIGTQIGIQVPRDKTGYSSTNHRLRFVDQLSADDIEVVEQFL